MESQCDRAQASIRRMMALDSRMPCITDLDCSNAWAGQSGDLRGLSIPGTTNLGAPSLSPVSIAVESDSLGHLPDICQSRNLAHPEHVQPLMGRRDAWQANATLRPRDASSAGRRRTTPSWGLVWYIPGSRTGLSLSVTGPSFALAPVEKKPD